MTLRYRHTPVIVFALTLLIALASTGGVLVADASDPPLSAALLARVPEAYRERAKDIRMSTANQERAQARDDLAVFSLVIAQIARTTGGVPFLFDMIEKETSAPRRSQLLASLASAPDTPSFLDDHPHAVDAYVRDAASNPDPKSAIQTLTALRRLRQRQFSGILKQRMALARTNGDQKGLEDLSEEESLHYKWFGEIAMPPQYRDAPASFSVSTSSAETNKAIRAVAFGDFGTGEASHATTPSPPAPRSSS